MSNRSRILYDLPITSGQVNTLRVTLEYRIGGHNWFTGENVPRGIAISVSPLEVKEHSTSYLGFSGTAMHIFDMTRFNAKTLREFKPTDEQLDRLINHVIADQNLDVDMTLRNKDKVV